MEKKIFDQGKLNKESYMERVKNYDPKFAEKRFEDYCIEKGYNYKKLLLNSNENLFESPIPHWTKLGLMIAQPDYFCYNKEKQLYAEIKASNKLKHKDLKKYCAWEMVMCDTKYTEYWIVFCFRDKLVFKTINQILDMLPQSKTSQYHEGNKYYILPI